MLSALDSPSFRLPALDFHAALHPETGNEMQLCFMYFASKNPTLCIALLVELQNEREQASTQKTALTECINPHIIILGIFLRRLVYKTMMI